MSCGHVYNVFHPYRDVYRQKLEDILMASGSKMEVEIKYQANRYLTFYPREISISSLISEGDDALVILTDSSNVHIGRDIMKKKAKRNEVGIMPVLMKIINGEHRTASVPYPWTITNCDTSNVTPLFLNTTITDDLPQQTTNNTTTDKNEIGIRNDRSLAAGLPSSSVRNYASEFFVSDGCFRQRNTFYPRRAIKQKKNGWTTASSGSSEVSLDDISNDRLRLRNTATKSHHPCRQSLHEPSYVDKMMNQHGQMAQKAADMDERLTKLCDETSRFFPVMPTEQKTKEPETTHPILKENHRDKLWKTPFVARAKIFHKALASENSKTEACEQLTKEVEEKQNDKKDVCFTDEQKREDGRDVCEKYIFPKILMKMRKERSQNKPNTECTNHRSNASVPVVDDPLKNAEFVDIFENLCQAVTQMAISPSSHKRNTKTPLIKNLLKRITKK